MGGDAERRGGAADGHPPGWGGQPGAWGYGEESPSGWEGQTVSTYANPVLPWATVVGDDGGKHIIVQPWDFWKSKEPTRRMPRRACILWVPNKR